MEDASISDMSFEDPIEKKSKKNVQKIKKKEKNDKKDGDDDGFSHQVQKTYRSIKNDNDDQHVTDCVKINKNVIIICLTILLAVSIIGNIYQIKKNKL